MGLLVIIAVTFNIRYLTVVIVGILNVAEDFAAAGLDCA